MRSFSNTPRALATALLMASARAVAAGEPAPAREDFLDSPAVIGFDQWRFDPVLPLLQGPHEHTTSRFAPLDIPMATNQATQPRATAGITPDTLPLESANDRMRRLHGFTDVSFGAQWHVRGGDAGWLPSVAWLADVETMTGTPAFRDGNVRPSLRATAQWSLPQDLSLGVMPGLYRDRGEDGRHFAAGMLAVTLGKSWTPRLQSFVELAGQRLSRAQADASLVNLDTGLAFNTSKTTQVDMVVSRNLAGGASQQVRGGLSVSSRF